MEIAAQLKDATTQREFAELLERNRGLVFKVANGYGRDAEDRADLAQEIAAQLWRAWPAYDPSRPLATWMYRIALNVAISHLRGRSRPFSIVYAPHRRQSAATRALIDMFTAR